jgi:hypothetical protein
VSARKTGFIIGNKCKRVLLSRCITVNRHSTLSHHQIVDVRPLDPARGAIQEIASRLQQ